MNAVAVAPAKARREIFWLSDVFMWVSSSVLLPDFGDDALQVLSGQAGVFVGEIQAHGFAVDEREGMAQLEADIAAVADGVHAADGRRHLLPGCDSDPGRTLVVFAAIVGEHLE